MRCKNCGGMLKINENTCPYCGMINEEVVLNQRDIEDLEKDLNKTKKEIIKKRKKDAKIDAKTNVNLNRNIKLLVIACVLPIIMLIIIGISDNDIFTSKEKEQAKLDKFFSRVENEEYLLAGYSYYEESLYSIDGAYENGVNKIGDICNSYCEVYDNILRYMENKVNKDSYYTEEDLIDDVIDEIDRFYTCIESIDKYNFERKKLAETTAQKIENKIIDMLYIAFDFDISKEEYMKLGKNAKMAEIERRIYEKSN